MGIEQSLCKMSWADEVEALPASISKESLWDNFDTGFKLEYVAPDLFDKSSISEIELEDISTEVAYWKNAIVCYVLGAYPPFTVMNGYVRRQWGKYGVDKVSMLKKGIVLVQFDNSKGKNEVLHG